MDSLNIAIFSIQATFMLGLIGIIYGNLNKKQYDNSCYIKAVNDEMRKEYITKSDYASLKADHALEHSRISVDFDKQDKKLDRILQILLEGKHEK